MKRADCPLHVVKPEPEPADPTKPAKLQRFMDPQWKYTRSESTDISRLFARVKRELAQKAKPAKGKK